MTEKSKVKSWKTDEGVGNLTCRGEKIRITFNLPTETMQAKSVVWNI